MLNVWISGKLRLPTLSSNDSLSSKSQSKDELSNKIEQSNLSKIPKSSPVKSNQVINPNNSDDSPGDKSEGEVGDEVDGNAGNKNKDSWGDDFASDTESDVGLLFSIIFFSLIFEDSPNLPCQKIVQGNYSQLDKQEYVLKFDQR